jgi:two-component system, LytTR family, sensor kinase
MKTSVNKKRFILYLWIGLVYFLLRLMADLASDSDATFAQRLFNNLWLAVYVTALNFIFFEYTVPYIKFTWRRLLPSLFLIWVHLMLYSYGIFAWRFVGIGAGIYTSLKTYASVEDGVTNHFGFSVGSIVFFVIALHVYDYRKLKQAAQQLRIEKQEAELNYLKSQTNPHFLFNTLNNIYSLARDKSDLAPESILRLSKILRFMLYEAGGEYIAIEQELKIISDYIALERLRYDESLGINFNHDVEDMRQSLPPLLLIPLVENAFKHGVSETRSRPFVDIHLSVNNRQLEFSVKNSTEEFPEQKGGKENIGLSNLRRQLELLYRDYALSVQQSDSTFIAKLKINLSSHVSNKMYNNRR